ncbi:MAG TPA: hypothetical protein VJU61_01125, partial [Polyangiaceae bacterium]|nr:hypothetical protein [Polyangiaceae bacterium]
MIRPYGTLRWESVAHEEPTELTFEVLRKSEMLGDFIKELIAGNRGAAVDVLVGAVVALATGTPALAVGATQASRLLRERAEAATVRLQKEYERLRQESDAQRQQTTVEMALADRVEAELRVWFVSTLKVLADVREGVQRTEAKVDAQGELLES